MNTKMYSQATKLQPVPAAFHRGAFDAVLNLPHDDDAYERTGKWDYEQGYRKARSGQGKLFIRDTRPAAIIPEFASDVMQHFIRTQANGSHAAAPANLGAPNTYYGEYAYHDDDRYRDERGDYHFSDEDSQWIWDANGNRVAFVRECAPEGYFLRRYPLGDRFLVEESPEGGREFNIIDQDQIEHHRMRAMRHFAAMLMNNKNSIPAKALAEYAAKVEKASTREELCAIERPKLPRTYVTLHDKSDEIFCAKLCRLEKAENAKREAKREAANAKRRATIARKKAFQAAGVIARCIRDGDSPEDLAGRYDVPVEVIRRIAYSVGGPTLLAIAEAN